MRRDSMNFPLPPWRRTPTCAECGVTATRRMTWKRRLFLCDVHGETYAAARCSLEGFASSHRARLSWAEWWRIKRYVATQWLHPRQRMEMLRGRRREKRILRDVLR